MTLVGSLQPHSPLHQRTSATLGQTSGDVQVGGPAQVDRTVFGLGRVHPDETECSGTVVEIGTAYPSSQSGQYRLLR